MSRVTGPDRAAGPSGDAIPLERALAARAMAGDADAFRRIYDRYAPGVHRFLRDLLRDDAAADEATQETFVRAHGKLAAIKDADRLGPWLFGIARNVSLELFRQRRGGAGPGAVDAGEALADASHPAPGPEAALLGREADELLARAMQALSADRRSALLLQMDHDLSYDEIAAVMGWSLAKVKVEIHRARLDLRARLATYLGEKA